MSLLFCDGFDDGLASSKWSIAPPVTTGGRYGNRTSGSGANGVHGRYVLPTGVSTIIVGFAFRCTDISSGSTIAGIGNSPDGVTAHLTIDYNTSGQIIFYRGSTEIARTSPGTIWANDSWDYMEIKLTVHDTTGSLAFRLNTVELINVSGIDTRNGGTVDLAGSVDFYSGSPKSRDDLYVCDDSGSVNNDFLGDVRISTLLPNGNGNSSQLVGSDANSVDNYLLVDESVPSSADYAGSATEGDKDTYTFGDIPSGYTTVFGVIPRVHAAKSDAGTKFGQIVTRSGGVDYSSASFALNTSYGGQYADVHETDPDTGLLWTDTAVNNAEFGFEVRDS